MTQQLSCITAHTVESGTLLLQPALEETNKTNTYKKMIQLPHGDDALQDLIFNFFCHEAVCLQISANVQLRHTCPVPFPLPSSKQYSIKIMLSAVLYTTDTLTTTTTSCHICEQSLVNVHSLTLNLLHDTHYQTNSTAAPTTCSSAG